MKHIVNHKLVKSGETTRWVFSNPRNKLQVGVLTRTSLYPALPHIHQVKLVLSLPIEGMNGVCIRCEGFHQAWTIANRECYRRGKLLNRLFVFPILFAKGCVY
jgi:hypothetical protein